MSMVDDKKLGVGEGLARARARTSCRTVEDAVTRRWERDGDALLGFPGTTMPHGDAEVWHFSYGRARISLTDELAAVACECPSRGYNRSERALNRRQCLET